MRKLYRLLIVVVALCQMSLVATAATLTPSEKFLAESVCIGRGNPTIVKLEGSGLFVDLDLWIRERGGKNTSVGYSNPIGKNFYLIHDYVADSYLGGVHKADLNIHSDLAVACGDIDVGDYTVNVFYYRNLNGGSALPVSGAVSVWRDARVLHEQSYIFGIRAVEGSEHSMFTVHATDKLLTFSRCARTIPIRSAEYVMQPNGVDASCD